EPVEDPRHQRDVSDVDRPAEHPLQVRRDLVPGRVGDGVGTHSTITFPYIVWCPSPQYSWQMTTYSPGSRNVYVALETWPGMSIRFTFVFSIWNPWSTSGVVAMNVISAPAGIRISLGTKLHAWPMTTTS